MSYEVLQLALFTNDVERVKPIEKIVSPLGWHLIATVMQKQPIQWITEQNVELILLDLDIPTSINLIGSLKRSHPNLPIVALTSENSLSQLQSAKSAGATDYIMYPVNAKHLMAALHQAIGERSTTVSNIIPDFDDMPQSTSNGKDKSRVTVSTLPVTSPAPSPAASSIAASSILSSSVPTSRPPSIPLKEKEIAVPAVESRKRAARVPTAQTAVDSNVSDRELLDHVEVAEPIKAAQTLDEMREELKNEIRNEIRNEMRDEPGPVPAAPRTPVATTANASVDHVDHVDHVEVSHRTPQTRVLPQTVVQPAAQPDRARENGEMARRTAPPENSQSMQFQTNYGVTTSLQSIQGKITAVVSLRGGIGRSTIATNLAVAIAQQKIGSVTLVEAHHGLSNISLMLHLHPRRTLSTIEDEHTIDHDIIQGYLQPHASGVNVLSAPTEIDEMIELAPETWSHLLSTAAGLAHHTIVDTASAADSALMEVLLQANEILVITDPDIASLRSASALYQNIYSEPSISGQISLIINRVGIKGGLDEKAIQKQLGQETVASLPYDPALTTYAMNRGIPFVQSHPRSLLSKRIQGLTSKIASPPAGSNQQAIDQKPAAKSSFMSILGR